MKENRHTSKLDIIFLNDKKKYFDNLEIQYLHRIDKAADTDFIISIISDEISEQNRRLSTDSELLNHINNHFIHDILSKFDDCLKTYLENPIEIFIQQIIPNLRIEHIQKMDKFPGCYSFEKGFINAEDKQIISLISQYRAMIDFQKQINNLTPIQQNSQQVEKINETTVESLKNTEEKENNFLLSTIEEYLEDVKEYMPKDDYQILIGALNEYFKNGAFPPIKHEIKVTNINLKKFGWALNQVYRNCKDDNSNLPIEYLKFAKNNISIFKNSMFNEKEYFNSNLYKYFTTKTQ